jgi:hypothetical protein
VISPTRTRVSSIRLATVATEPDEPPTSFSVSALATATSTSTTLLQPSASQSQAAASSSKTSTALVAGLVSGLTVVIIVLVVVLLKCTRKRAKPATPDLDSRSDIVRAFPPPPPIPDDASYYPASEKGTLRPNKSRKVLSKRASVASWFSGRRAIARRSVSRFEWYR